MYKGKKKPSWRGVCVTHWLSCYSADFKNDLMNSTSELLLKPCFLNFSILHNKCFQFIFSNQLLEMVILITYNFCVCRKLSVKKTKDCFIWDCITWPFYWAIKTCTLVQGSNHNKWNEELSPKLKIKVKM